MQYRQLGESGINASVVGFGVWTVSTTMWGITDESVRMRLLQRALDLGINFFDTADVYGDGAGETILAKALAGRRDDVVIATKFGYDFYSYPGLQPGQRERPHDWSPAYVRKACEQSLRRLGTDRIDLYQLHNPRLNALTGAEADDLWAELEAIRAEGKVRVLGAALGPALRADRQSQEGIASIQVRHAAPQIIYNMLEQPLGEAIFPVAREENVPVLVRVPHASGLLEGRFDETTEFGPEDHRHFRMHTPEMKAMWLRGLKKAEKVAFLAADGERTIGQAAVQFVLAEPSVGSVLPNIYDEAQLVELAQAPDTPPLTRSDLDRVADLYSHDFYIEPAAATA